MVFPCRLMVIPRDLPALELGRAFFGEGASAFHIVLACKTVGHGRINAGQVGAFLATPSTLTASDTITIAPGKKQLAVFLP